MEGDPGDARRGFTIETGNVRLKVTAYTGGMKATGTVYVNISGRTTDRRPSDLLRHFPDRYMTLSQVELRRLVDDEPVQELPFILLNLELVEALYAEEVE